MPQNQQPRDSHRPLKVVRCRCGAVFQVKRRGANHTCADCKRRKYDERRDQYKHQVPAALRHPWRRLPVQLPDDFLRAERELKAEYQRVAHWNPNIWIEPSDPVALPRPRRF